MKLLRNYLTKGIQILGILTLGNFIQNLKIGNVLNVLGKNTELDIRRCDFVDC